MGTKITALPPVITPVGTDELPISQATGLTGRTTYKATLDQIKSYIGTGQSGSVTSVGVNSTDGSIGVFGSPITSSGTISLTISSVELDKLDDGGAIGGEVLTYNGSTSAWEPGFGGSSGIIPNILVGNGGTTYTLTNYTNDTASNYLVFVGGVAQRPTTDFTISGSSIIFGSSIPSGAQILVYAVINIATLNVDATPIGTVTWFAASAAPTSYLECSGGVVPISDYLDLYYVIGTKYNTGGEGAGNFRVPDLRGEFIRGWDHGRNVNTGRVFGSNESDATATPKNTSPDRLLGNGTTSNNLVNAAHPSIVGFARVSKTGEAVTATSVDGDPIGQADVLNVVIGDSETRPRNVALLPCIKARKTVTGDVSTLNFIEKPASPTNGQVLTYNGSTSTWVASAAPTPIANIQAYVSFDGTRDDSGTTNSSNTNRFIYSSNNVSSVLKNSTGNYTITFTNSFANSNYVAFGTTDYIPPGLGINAKTSANCTIVTYQQGPGYYDTSIVDVFIVK
jgi:microcystin-dependent protein